MSDIPLAREILMDTITNEHKMSKKQIVAQMTEALRLMHREAVARPHAPRQRSKMTAAIGAKVRVYARKNPHKTLDDIGREFGVDGGRVSEALHGKW